MSVSKSDRIVVTGGAGFLGSFVVEKLKARGYTNLIVPRRREYDLTSEAGAERIYQDHKPDVILHL
ncbi:MAG: GDP-L-fucose synthase, partial [Humisphaera sp.]|nr:GDP-L-fucose synthase [Humisphaera sp.]